MRAYECDGNNDSPLPLLANVSAIAMAKPHDSPLFAMFCCLRFGGVCERKKKCTRQKKRGYTAGGQVYCICFCFRARCSTFIYTYIDRYLYMYVYVRCQPPCPLPFPQPLSLLPSRERETSFLCLYTRMSSHVVVVVVALLLLFLLACLLYFIFFFRFRILPPPPPLHTITNTDTFWTYILTYLS